MKSSNRQETLRKVNRMAHEVMESDRDPELTKAIVFSSLERGNHVIYTIYLHEMKSHIKDVLLKQDDFNNKDMEQLHDLYVKCNKDLDIHKNICMFKKSELEFFRWMARS